MSERQTHYDCGFVIMYVAMKGLVRISAALWLAASAMSLLAIVGCSGGSEGGEATDSPMPSQTEPRITPEHTIDSTLAPTATEVVAEQPCLILPEEFCKNADLVQWPSPLGFQLSMVGIVLPEGTPLLSPVDGNITHAKEDELSDFVGFSGVIEDSSALNYTFKGNIRFDDKATVKKGDVIGYTTSGDKTFGKYDIVFAVSLLDPNKGFVSGDEELKRLFPTAFQKPPLHVSRDNTSSTTFLTFE